MDHERLSRTLARALDGHSLEGKLSMEETRPPDEHSDGISPAAARRIRRKGPRPMSRPRVPLPADRLAAVVRMAASGATLLLLAACGGEPADGDTPAPDAAARAAVDSPGYPGRVDGGPGPAAREAWEPGTGLEPDPGDWPTYGADPGQRRYARLPELDAAAASGMRRAWTVRTGVPGVFEATPVAIDGRLYLSTPTRDGEQRVLAMDGATGDRVWETRIAVGSSRPEPTRTSRGVAVGEGRVYLATLDARLLALDAADGGRLWETRTADPAEGYQHKQAPLYHEGRVYLGVSGGPLGIRGFVKAFDAETGRELWTWHSIPSPEEGGWWGEWTDTLPGTRIDLGRDVAGERADSARYAGAWRRGGGSVWMTPTLDAGRGLLFVGVGNPAPELTGRVRPGDNRWTSSVCALRADDGSTVWCRQIVPHDVWGLDAASPPFLLRHGDTLPAVGHFSKLGALYVWDRRDGRLLTLSEPYVPRENFLARPTPEGVRMAPGLYGGTEWSPAAFSPRTGLAYTAALHAPGRYFVRTSGPREGTVGFDLGPASGRRGVLAAVDPVSGEVVWSARTRRPMVAGSLVTAGDVVFAGLLSRGVAAWDARTGQRLWTGTTDFPCASGPAAYRARGRAFVVLTCGGHFFAGGGTGDQVVAFTPASAVSESQEE